MFIRKTFLLLSVIFLYTISIQAQNKFVRVYYDSLFSYFAQYTPISAITSLPSGNLLLNTAGNLAIKTNSVGEVIENKLLYKNGQLVSYNIISDFFTHSSGKIYFCGALNSDSILAGMVDSNLQILWSIGFTTEDFQFIDAHQCNNGDLLMLAYYKVSFANKPFVCRINASGNVLWQKELLLNGGGQNLIRSVNEDTNGNLYFGGYESLSGPIYSGYVIKTDAQLNVEFTFKIAGCQEGSAAIPLNNGNIRFFAANLIQGYPLAFADIDDNGSLVQLKGLKNTNLNYPNFNQIKLLSNGNMVVPVLNGSVALLLEQSGNVASLISYADTFNSSLGLYPYVDKVLEYGNNMVLTGSLLIGLPESYGILIGADKNTLETVNGYYASLTYQDTVLSQTNISNATAVVNNVDYDININSLSFESIDAIKDTAFGDIIIVFQNNKTLEKSFSTYPNPVNYFIYFNTPDANEEAEIIIYDLFGKEILKTIMDSADNELVLSSLEKGIYIMQVKQLDKTFNTRFVKR